jgi:hypothetical protein
MMGQVMIRLYRHELCSILAVVSAHGPLLFTSM